MTHQIELLLGGKVYAALKAEFAAKYFADVYIMRGTAFTADAHADLHRFGNFARIISTGIRANHTNGVPAFDPQEIVIDTPTAVSLFHITSELLTKDLADMRLVSAQIANNVDLDANGDFEDDESVEDPHNVEDLVDAICVQGSFLQIQRIIHRFEPDDTSETAKDQENALFDIAVEGNVQGILEAIKEFGYKFDLSGTIANKIDLNVDEDDDDGEDLADEEEDIFATPNDADYEAFKADLAKLPIDQLRAFAGLLGLAPRDADAPTLVDALANPSISDDVYEVLNFGGFHCPFMELLVNLEANREIYPELLMLPLHELEALCEVLEIPHEDMHSEEMVDAIVRKTRYQISFACLEANVMLGEEEDPTETATVEDYIPQIERIEQLSLVQAALSNALVGQIDNLVIRYSVN